MDSSAPATHRVGSDSGRAMTQLKALLRKNYILQKRNSRDLCREVLWPVALLMVLVSIRANVHNKNVASNLDTPVYTIVDKMSSLPLPDGYQDATQVLYTPCTAATDAVMKHVSDDYGGTTQCFPTEDKLQKYYLNNPTKVFGGVVFTADSSSTLLHSNASVSYSLRFDTDHFLRDVGETTFTSSWQTKTDDTPLQYVPYFVPIQRAIARAVTYLRDGGSTPEYSYNIREYPTQAYEDNVATQALGGVLPIYLLLIYSIQIRVLLTRILEEKEAKIKEGMRMMGLSDGVFWASWLITAGLKQLIVTVVIVLVTKLGKLFEHSSFSVLIVFFVLFNIICILFAFVCTTLFSSSRTGGAVGMILFIALSTPAYGLSSSSISAGAQTFACLLPPLAFNFGASLLNDAEKGGVGASWSNISTKFSSDLNVGLNTVMLMMLVNIALLGLLMWYLDKVVPNEYGTTLKPWFFLTKSYWMGPEPLNERQSLLADETGGNAAIEPVSADVAARRCVRIQNLTKIFDTPEGPKTAVDGLNLEMYEGQLTALLGHNGAGKTTTVSMLTGLFSPTSGDAHVFGSPISTHMADVRRLIGVCPQHDILWKHYTVREHLELFAGVKNMPNNQETEAAITRMIAEVGLTEKAESDALSLSGGQKRRLSVAMALLGNPQVVFLDEPTSGLDPASRRQMWSLFQRAKHGRVMIFSTHDMSEAEILADRVAIMARGKLRVAGSSLFLKSRFGIGYHLIVLTNPGSDIPAITARIQTHVSLAKLAGGADAPTPDGRYQLDYVLPLDTLPSFAALFADLDSDLARLGIASYGLSATNLEEVFLRLASAVKQEEQEIQDRNTAKGGGSDKRARASSDVHMDLQGLGKLHRYERTAIAEELEEDGGQEESKSSAVLHSAALDVDTGDEDERQALSLNHSGPGAGGGSGGGQGAGGPTHKLGRDRYASILASLSTVGPSRASFGEQARAQFWRRLRQARRDKRGLFLQMVLPLAFVCISFLFRNLRQIGESSISAPFDLSTSQLGVQLHPSTLPYGLSSSKIPVHLPELLPADPAADPWQPFVNSTMNTYFPKNLQGLPPTSVLPSTSSWTTIMKDLFDSKYTSGTFVFEPSAAAGYEYQATLLYNSSFTNSIPILTAVHDTAVLRSIAAKSGASKTVQDAISVNIRVKPFPRSSLEKKHSTGEYLSSAFMGFYIALGFCTIPALMAVNVVKEREVNAKQLQLIMGMSIPSYWVSVWVWDFIQFTLPWAGSAILVYVFGTDTFKDGSNYVALVLLIGLYGASIPGMTYCISFLFKTSAMAQTAIMASYSLLTMVLFFASFLLEYPTLGLPSIAGDIVRYVGMLFPHYALAKGFADVGLKGGCPVNVDDCSPPSAFSWDLAGQKLVFLAFMIPVWFLVIIYVERRLSPMNSVDGFQDYRDADLEARAPADDEDVIAERARVNNPGCDDNIIARGLRKVFKTKPNPKVAVQSIDLGCGSGECLGLLGPNGAGKTTTLAMLTGDLAPTSGQALLCNADIQKDTKAVFATMGYCPQFDALFDLLTGEECLTFYARIKGIPGNVLEDLVDASIKKMDLGRYRHQLTSTYSGGNKRKLSLAIAYIGAPRVVFLDEPSTGMDPEARRHMWDCVSSMKDGRSVILTSHALEEVEVLCSRIAIMVNGRLACIGTNQRLKSRFGSGYQLEVKTRDHTKEAQMHALVRSISPTAEVLESHWGHAKYKLDEGVSLADAFRVLESNRKELDIEDYCMSQTTLEQVFLAFAKRQEEADAHASSGAQE